MVNARRSMIDGPCASVGTADRATDFSHTYGSAANTTIPPGHVKIPGVNHIFL